MRNRYTPCPTPGCPELRDPTTGDCPNGHAAARRRSAQRLTDAQRPSARARGYDRAHERLFRGPVLRRDPTCTAPGCSAPSAHADHWPHTRRELLAMGENPNDPKWGRGLCPSHHSAHTARHDGGFGNPTRRTLAADSDEG